MEQKMCCKCNITKPISEFHSHGYRNTKAGKIKVHKPDCKVCANEKWQRQLDMKFSQLVTEWKCCICGYDKCMGALDFHHINQDEKDFTIASRYTISLEKLRQEIEKCILVCANCHREIHHGTTKVGV